MVVAEASVTAPVTVSAFVPVKDNVVADAVRVPPTVEFAVPVDDTSRDVGPAPITTLPLNAAESSVSFSVAAMPVTNAPEDCVYEVPVLDKVTEVRALEVTVAAA